MNWRSGAIKREPMRLHERRAEFIRKSFLREKKFRRPGSFPSLVFVFVVGSRRVVKSRRRTERRLPSGAADDGSRPAPLARSTHASKNRETFMPTPRKRKIAWRKWRAGRGIIACRMSTRGASHLFTTERPALCGNCSRRGEIAAFNPATFRRTGWRFRFLSALPLAWRPAPRNDERVNYRYWNQAIVSIHVTITARWHGIPILKFLFKNASRVQRSRNCSVISERSLICSQFPETNERDVIAL